MNGLLIIVGVIILIGALNGFSKGAVKILVSLLATVITIGLVFVISPFVSDALCTMTPLDERIEEQFYGAFEEWVTSETEQNEEIPRNDQIEFIENSKLPEAFKELLLSNNNGEVYAVLGVNTFMEYMVKYLTKLIMDILSFVITFIIVNIAVRLLIFALDFVADLPMLGILNRLSGMVVGSVLALIVVWLMFVVVTLLYSTKLGEVLMQMIAQDKYLQFLYDVNPIMKMMTTLN